MAVELRTIEQVSSDADRLSALWEMDILDTPVEMPFERITDLIKLVFGVEIGIVSMIDGHRQWYKSVAGLPTSEASLDSTFCKYTLQLSRPVIVPDATKDPRFYDNPHVTDGPRIRFYAGAPILTGTGQVIGTICAIDNKVHDFGERETAILMHLAGLVVRELELRLQTATDTLTGAASRRAFKEEAAKHMLLAQRHALPLSCITLDVDHFKSINDQYGHAAGDKVLIGIVNACKNHLRQSDIVARLGGEEFAILLPQTDKVTALNVAEKLRQLIKALHFPGSVPPISAAASFGVTAAVPGDDIDSLLHRADQALYEAKRSGRNRTCIAPEPDAPEKLNRRRVLKAAKIIFNDGNSTYDCTIRSLWENGAEITIPLPTSVPEQFDLILKGSSARHKCALLWRGTGTLEAAFV
jgi:diguanylate cyclase (GGDEF)-like protein